MKLPKCDGGFVILPDELRTRETLINFLSTEAGLPGGEDTYIQFNDDGAFGGSKNLIFDNSVGTMTAYHIRASSKIDTVRLSASSDLQVVGATILGSHLKVSASVTLGGGAGDYLSSSSGAQFKMSVSSSSDLAVTGAMHAANFYGTGVVSASGDLYGSNLYISAVGANVIQVGNTGATLSKWEWHRNGARKWVIYNDGRSSPSLVEDGLHFKAGTASDADATHLAMALKPDQGAKFYGDLTASGDVHVEGSVGIGTATPITALDIHHNPTGLSNDTGGGDVVTFGTEDGTDTLAAGKLMYLHSGSGVWKYTDADVAESGSSQLLGIALGAAVSDGILIRGFFDVHTNLNDTFAAGKPVYVCPDPGEFDMEATAAGGAFVRIVGYCTSTANVIYFNPSSTNIVLAS